MKFQLVYHKRREFDDQPCKFIELSTVVEFYFVETTFIFGINLLVAVPTTLRSV